MGHNPCRQETAMPVELWHDHPDDDDLRAAEREAVRHELEARLRSNGVDLDGSETDGQIVALVNAVEKFDAARARMGGDSMVNTADSARADTQSLVLPRRSHDESVDRYVSRVREAARRLA
jgi:hypothetical protein